MTKDYGLECMQAVDQLFCKMGSDSRIFLIVPKVVDYFITAGIQDAVRHFFEV